MPVKDLRSILDNTRLIQTIFRPVMSNSPFKEQILSLPQLAEAVTVDMDLANRQLFIPALSKRIQHVFITGCGDSYHAAVGSRLAFLQLGVYLAKRCRRLSFLDIRPDSYHRQHLEQIL